MSKPKRSDWRPGDPLPPSDARRFTHSGGYVVLTWEVGGVRYHAYEHRIVANAPAGMHVHHINGVKDDNRPENLELLDPASHHRHHNVLPEHNERKDVPNDAIRDLHRQGLSAREIGRRLSCSGTTVTNRLRKMGIAPNPCGRQPQWSKKGSAA